MSSCVILGANAISSSSNNPNSQPHQQQQHYNSYGHSIGGVGGVVSPPYSSYIQTTGSTTTTSSGESTASSRTNHRKNKRFMFSQLELGFLPQNCERGTFLVKIVYLFQCSLFTYLYAQLRSVPLHLRYANHCITHYN